MLLITDFSRFHLHFTQIDKRVIFKTFYFSFFFYKTEVTVKRITQERLWQFKVVDGGNVLKIFDETGYGKYLIQLDNNSGSEKFKYNK